MVERTDAATLMTLAVGVVAALIAFLLMRFPRLRRPQFRDYPASSITSATVSALLLLGVFLLFALLQR